MVHPGIGISKSGMKVMESLVEDIFVRLCEEARVLSRYGKSVTLDTRCILSAVRQVFPSELAKHAISEGHKAVLCYNQKHEK